MENKKLVALLYIIVLVGSFFLARSLDLNLFSNENKKVIDTRQYENEILSIYIGCSTCPGANAKKLPELIKNINDTLRSRAKSLNYNLIKVGVSKDYNVQVGIEYLNKFGNFNEISIGRNWNNIVIQHYVWEKKVSRPAVPQLIILTRNYIKSKNENIDYKKFSENEVVTLIGGVEMLSFYQNLSAFSVRD